MAKMGGYGINNSFPQGADLYLQTRYPSIQNFEKPEKFWSGTLVNQECSGNSKINSLNT